MRAVARTVTEQIEDVCSNQSLCLPWFGGADRDRVDPGCVISSEQFDRKRGRVKQGNVWWLLGRVSADGGAEESGQIEILAIYY